MSNTDTEVTVEASPSDWILAEAALSHVLSKRYQDLTSAIVGSWTAEVIKDGIRPLERVRHAILDAVYPEPEGPDGIDLAKRERDIIEDHGYPLISVGER